MPIIGCNATSKNGRATINAGFHSSRNESIFCSCGLLANIEASMSMSEIFINSLGWKPTEPNRYQLTVLLVTVASRYNSARRR